MAVKAKFKCIGVKKVVGWGPHDFLYSAEFSAVTDKDGDYKEFFAATPSGSITLSTVRADLFEVGKVYDVGFEQDPSAE